jgi:flagellar biosynthesis protein FlhF
MRIKKYTAKSMKEALLQIKQDLGEEAIILKTSHAPGKLFSQGDIEVTAALDEDARTDASLSHQAFAPLRVTPTRVSDTGVYKRPKPGPEMPKPDVLNRRKADLQSRAAEGQDLDKKYETIKADIGELKLLFRNFMAADTRGDARMDAREEARSGAPPEAEGLLGGWALLYKKLVGAEVMPAVAREFVKRICTDSPAQTHEVVQRFVDELNAFFTPSAPQPAGGAPRPPKVIMFVGPTGAGKTTTLAKLAAQHALGGRKSVSLITSDTYRIAAIEQIRTFADIMNIPLHIVFSPEEADQALAACASSDIVFVDTAGRSQKSAEHMGELSGLIKRMKPDEVHCVLSAGTKASDLCAAIEKYKQLGVNRLLFTKLDETMKLGNVFTAAVQSGIPFSYFAFGQRVPDDIERAQPHRLVARLFEEVAA